MKLVDSKQDKPDNQIRKWNWLMTNKINQVTKYDGGIGDNNKINQATKYDGGIGDTNKTNQTTKYDRGIGDVE